MSRVLAGWLAAAGALAVLSLGFPWAPLTAGTGAPARVAIAAAAALVLFGITGCRDQLLSVAVLVGTAGVLVGGPTPTPGRLALAAAVACLAVGLRVDGRRVLPARWSPRR